jgi:hypothetical protein
VGHACQLHPHGVGDGAGALAGVEAGVSTGAGREASVAVKVAVAVGVSRAGIGVKRISGGVGVGGCGSGTSNDTTKPMTMLTTTMRLKTQKPIWV